MNFAGLFPVWDLLGGTYEWREPETFGFDEPVPERYLGQLAFPFERAAPR